MECKECGKEKPINGWGYCDDCNTRLEHKHQNECYSREEEGL